MPGKQLPVAIGIDINPGRSQISGQVFVALFGGQRRAHAHNTGISDRTVDSFGGDGHEFAQII